MVVCMHYCGSAVLAKLGSAQVNRDIAAGRHISTLAFSEAGSRSHFWAPVGTARLDGDSVVLDAKKSWITSARHATAYVWSSKPVEGTGASTLWLVPGGAPGISFPAPYNGLGLRGNDSAPVGATGVRVDLTSRLGADGGGFDLMMGVVLPLFSACNAACALGIADSAVAKACAHATGTTYQHLGSALRDLPTIRAYLARARLQVDMATALWNDTLVALETGRADAMLRVLEVKAAAGETASEVTATTMRVCGGAAYRKDVGVERNFRDAQAMGVMAPTTDVLYDFIGKAITGLDLF
jgi:alkylation response protein AidB-like acyl-CoA dehydrogenase